MQLGRNKVRVANYYKIASPIFLISIKLQVVVRRGRIADAGCMSGVISLSLMKKTSQHSQLRRSHQEQLSPYNFSAQSLFHIRSSINYI